MGWRLLPSRVLARELGISRLTVVDAYEQLAAEGYVVARVGDGSYVAQGVGPIKGPAESRIIDNSAVEAQNIPEPFRPLGFRSDLIDFRTGLPELSSFPLPLWRRLTREVLDGITPKDLAYGEPQGIAELRDAIATYLVGRRGLRCSAEDIVVVAGTTQAVGLVAQLFATGKRSQVVVEDPVTADIRRILASRGATCVPVPVDDHGLQTALLPSELDPALLYVTPSHQYPLGGILPARRRLELVQYARDHGSFVAEDDYDTEFRFGGSPVGSIQELAPDRVIYIGSFSKTIYPGLRVAFVVMPSALIDKAREAKWHADLHNPVIEQKVLTRFLQEGHFERHLQRSRRQLARKHELLRTALEANFGDSVQILGAAAGLHLAARFLHSRFTDAFIAGAENEGIKLYRASDHAYNNMDWSDTLLFGFGMLGTPQIERGIDTLRGLLNRSTEAWASSR